MNTIKTLTKNRLVICFFAVIALTLVFKAPYLSLFYTLFLCIITIKLPGTLKSNLLFRVIISFLLLLTVFQIETVVFYLFKIVINSEIINIVTLTIIMLIAVLSGNKFSDIKKYKISDVDFKVLIAPVIIIFIVLAGIINLNRGINTSILSSFLYASDNGAHIEMFSLNARNDGNLFKTSYQYVHSDEDFAYPMGWHNATAIVFRSFVSNVDDIPYIVTVYWYFAMFIMTLFMTLISLSFFVFYFYKKHSKNIKKITTIVVLPIITTIIGFIGIFPLYKMGFYNYLPIIAYTLMASTILLCLENKKELLFSTIIILIMSCGVVGSWILPFPIYLLFSAAVFIYYLMNKSHKEMLIVGLAAAGAFAIGIIVIKKSMLGGISSSSLANGGGLPQSFDELFISVSLIFGLIYLVKSKIFSNGKINAFPVFLFLIFLGVISLKIYFLIKGYDLGYYYTKFSYMLIVPCGAILMVSIVTLIEERQPHCYFSLPITVIVILAIGMYGNNYSSFSHWINYINTAKYLSNDVSKIIIDEYKKPYNNEVAYLYAVYDGEPGIAEIFFRLVNINKYNDNGQCINSMSETRGSLEGSKALKIKMNCKGSILSISDGKLY